MLTARQLLDTVTALETAAGASTTANANEDGFWLRIALAAESLAGATTSANLNTAGLQSRTALALEAVAGTTGGENTNESGWLKRIVDALEALSGSVETGSLGRRLMLGAQNASFEEELANLIDNGGFDDTSAWTLGATSTISGGVLNLATGESASQDTVSAIVEGSFYRLTFTLVSITGDGDVSTTLGGVDNPVIATAVGTYEMILKAGATQSLNFSVSLGDAVLDDVTLEGPLTVTLGANIVPNGGFDDDTGWTVAGSNATIDAGTFNVGGGAGSKSALATATDVVVAGWYRATFDVTARVSGLISARVANESLIPTASSVGAKVQEGYSLAAVQTVGLSASSGANLSADNLAIYPMSFS